MFIFSEYKNSSGLQHSQSDGEGLLTSHIPADPKMMLSLAPLFVLATFLGQVVAQPGFPGFYPYDFPYCADGAWNSFGNSLNGLIPDSGGIKFRAYNDRVLHVSGVFSFTNSIFPTGTVKSATLMTGKSTAVMDLTDAFEPGVSTGVFSKTFDIAKKASFTKEYLHMVKQQSPLSSSPTFYLLNNLDTQFSVVIETTGGTKISASLGSCFESLCYSSTPYNFLSGGIASVIVKVNLDASINIRGEFFGLSGNTTAAHIHAVTSQANVLGSIPATTLPSLPGFPLGVTAGKFNVRLDIFNASTLNPGFIAANGNNVYNASNVLLNAIADGHAYMNIHTTAYPDGEIAGFFTPCVVQQTFGF